MQKGRAAAAAAAAADFKAKLMMVFDLSLTREKIKRPIVKERKKERAAAVYYSQASSWDFFLT
jgi:hypothetical protein